MRLLVLGAIVLSLSMTLHLHRWMNRQVAEARQIENNQAVSAAERRDDYANLAFSGSNNISETDPQTTTTNLRSAATAVRLESTTSKNETFKTLIPPTLAPETLNALDSPGVKVVNSSETKVLSVDAATTTQEASQRIELFQRGNSTHPRIAYLTYAHLKETDRFEELIFPALETWHPLDEPYFVILSNQWKSRYDELLLVSSNSNNFSHYQSRMQMVFVNCSEGKTPEVECCKQEEGMLYMMEHYDYDWIVYLDDDNYIRSTFLRQFLTNMPMNELMVGTSGPSARYLGIYGYLPFKSSYKCSREKSYSYPWGQVVAYNRATLHHIHRGLQLHGLLKQCLEYDIYHDVGNAMFHWMYNLPEFQLKISDRPNEGHRNIMGCHGIGRCKFPCTMVDMHERYGAAYYQPEIPKAFIPMWRNASGFQTTRTFGTHGDPSLWKTEWHTMPVVDCLGPTTQT